MTSTAAGVVVDLPVAQWHAEVIARVALGQRFAGAYCTHRGDTAQLHALLVGSLGVDCLRASLTAGDDGSLTYPALTLEVPAAFWYERALHDLSGVVPAGHPRLDPLLLPREPGQPSPRPGHTEQSTLDRRIHSTATERHGPVDVHGQGVFSLPLGPVRSGVFESIEFLIETAGEDIPHMNIRPHYKHRGIAKRFEGLSVSDGILVAERVEGIASVAHALAFAHAVETLAGLHRAAAGPADPRRARRTGTHRQPPRRCGAAVRRRRAWGSDRPVRLAQRIHHAAGLSAVRQPIWALGGVRRRCGRRAEDRASRPRRERLSSDRSARIGADRRALMGDATFLDRVRGTGHLDNRLAASHGALGPVGRGSGFDR